nr:hypothetical protein [Angustibacter aerolatus]
MRLCSTAGPADSGDRHDADEPADAPPSEVLPPFVTVERRPLLTSVLTGRLAPVDGAALTYLPPGPATDERALAG